MFRNRKISYIVGASIGALILILQVMPPFTQIGPSFGTPDRAGLSLIQMSWIFLMVSAFLIVTLGFVGAFVMMKERFARHVNIYGLIYNISLFLPVIFCGLILAGDLLSVFALMAESVPDAFVDAFIFTVPAFYVVLLIAIAMPIASHVKKIRKPKQLT